MAELISGEMGKLRSDIALWERELKKHPAGSARRAELQRKIKSAQTRLDRMTPGVQASERQAAQRKRSEAKRKRDAAARMTGTVGRRDAEVLLREADALEAAAARLLGEAPAAPARAAPPAPLRGQGPLLPGQTRVEGSYSGNRPAAPPVTRDVRAVQRSLIEQGYNPGPVDGVWGPRTQAAWDEWMANGQQPKTAAAPTLSAPATGGGGSGAPAPAGTPATPAAASSANVETEIARLYPDLAPFLDHPEIGSLLRRAAAEGWDELRLGSAVRSTKWWKTTGPDARNFWLLRTRDPAAAEDKLDDLAKDMVKYATGLGVSLTYDEARTIGERHLTTGDSTGQVTDDIKKQITARFDPTSGELRGELAGKAIEMKAKAKLYGVRLDDMAVRQWIKQIATGDQTDENFDAYLREQAKSRYPWMAKDIDAGTTPTQWLSPYFQDAAAILELNPAELDLFHPLIAGATGQVDEKGQPRLMGQWEYQQWLRDRPEFKGTKGAEDAVSSFVELLGSTFGKVA